MKKILISAVLTLTINLYTQVNFSPAFPSLIFTSPVFLTHSGDGTNRIFVVEQSGVIRVFPNDSSAASYTTFLNLTNKVIAGGERGLLGLAFHPNYNSNRFFYVYYTRVGDGALVISRFTTQSGNPNKADSLSELNIITIAHPTYANHNGGCLMFGQDGYLYMGPGDGGSGGDPNNNAQDTTRLLGKILRLDINNPSGGNNYGIPPGNPLTGINGGKREIFAWGVRNPWRFSRDPVTNIIYMADVGQDAWEEVDTLSVGKNYGWRCYEGNHPYNTSGCGPINTYTFPIKEYQNFSVDCSITGGYVYRGSRVSWLVGRYVYADYCSRKVWKLLYSGGTVSDTSLIGSAPAAVLSFGVDQNNELYVCCLNGIYKFNDLIIGINGNNNSLPQNFFLDQNYPNPFNPSTTINYSVEKAVNVSIKIYSVLGREVAQLVNEYKQPGNYSVKWNAENFPSGIYVYRMSVDGLSIDKKMVLLK